MAIIVKKMNTLGRWATAALQIQPQRIQLHPHWAAESSWQRSLWQNVRIMGHKRMICSESLNWWTDSKLQRWIRNIHPICVMLKCVSFIFFVLQIAYLIKTAASNFSHFSTVSMSFSSLSWCNLLSKQYMRLLFSLMADCLFATSLSDWKLEAAISLYIFNQNDYKMLLSC